MMGRMTSTTSASLGLMARVSTTLAMSMVAARMRMRRQIMAVFWMLVTSLVMRVMREEEENLSMSAKEKEEIFSNSARRRLAPRPWAALVAHLAAAPPAKVAIIATRTMSRPACQMGAMFSFMMPSLMIWAMSRGMVSSQPVSRITSKGEAAAYFS